jgi:glycine/D-amino acid oxidase-like deaminating enzyme
MPVDMSNELPRQAEVVICGAGIAGVAAAFFLSDRFGIQDILLVDERPPLSLTSDKSTECYRNWWPGPDDAMVRLMNRSIDLLEGLAESSGNAFQLNRRGYLFATPDPAGIPAMRQSAQQAAALGAGPLRQHTGQSAGPAYQPAPPEGYQGQPDGADLILDPALIFRHFPYLAPATVAVLHVRRAGWFSAQQLGMLLLSRAQAHGVRLVQARLAGVTVDRGRVAGVTLDAAGRRETILTGAFVNAAGPYLGEVGRMLGVELPVTHELHLKASIRDALAVMPRHAPLLIWQAAQRLPWSADEAASLAESQEARWLLETMPAGVHSRPEGGPESQNILLLWDYHTAPVAPVYPLELDSLYPEIALRGMAAMLPGLSAYFDRLPRPYLDGGYYTKTRENRLLSGPLPVRGGFVLGALSGFGLMAACGAAELLACTISGAELPSYAPAFSLARYDDPAYRQRLADWGPSGQL